MSTLLHLVQLNRKAAPMPDPHAPDPDVAARLSSADCAEISVNAIWLRAVDFLYCVALVGLAAICIAIVPWR